MRRRHLMIVGFVAALGALIYAVSAAAIPITSLRVSPTPGTVRVSAILVSPAAVDACGARWSISIYRGTRAGTRVLNRAGAADVCRRVHANGATSGSISQSISTARIAPGRYAVCLAALQTASDSRKIGHTVCRSVKLAPKPRPKKPAPPPRPVPPSGNCDPNYSGACVPRYPPDVDCDDVGATVRVVGSDPHRLDRDGDRIACE